MFENTLHLFKLNKGLFFCAQYIIFQFTYIIFVSLFYIQHNLLKLTWETIIDWADHGDCTVLSMYCLIQHQGCDCRLRFHFGHWHECALVCLCCPPIMGSSSFHWVLPVVCKYDSQMWKIRGFGLHGYGLQWRKMKKIYSRRVTESPEYKLPQYSPQF